MRMMGRVWVCGRGCGRGMMVHNPATNNRARDCTCSLAVASSAWLHARTANLAPRVNTHPFAPWMNFDRGCVCVPQCSCAGLCICALVCMCLCLDMIRASVSPTQNVPTILFHTQLINLPFLLSFPPHSFPPPFSHRVRQCSSSAYWPWH